MRPRRSLTGRFRALFGGYDRRIWVLYAGFVASAMGFAMVVPFISIYFHNVLGVPMSLVGTFFLVTAVVRAVFQGYAGDLSDRIGRIGIMVSGQAGRGVLFLVMALAIFRGAGFWVSAGILVLSYVAGAFYQPVASAAVADLVPGERRLDAYSLMRIANNLGWGVGPMLGGFVAGKGYGWLFLIGAATSFVSAGLIGGFLKETWRPVPAGAAADDASARSAEAPSGPVPRRRGAQWTDMLDVRHDRRFAIYCGLALLVFISMSQWLSTLSVYAADHLHVSTAQLGLMYGLNGFMVVALQLPVTRLLGGMSMIGAMTLGSLVYAAAYFGFSFATVYTHLVIGMIVITLGELIFSPAADSMVSLIAPPGRTGRYMGAYSLTASFGWSIGPFIGGVLIDLFAGRPFALWSSIAAIALLAAAGFRRWRGLYPARPVAAQG